MKTLFHSIALEMAETCTILSCSLPSTCSSFQQDIITNMVLCDMHGLLSDSMLCQYIEFLVVVDNCELTQNTDRRSSIPPSFVPDMLWLLAFYTWSINILHTHVGVFEPCQNDINKCLWVKNLEKNPSPTTPLNAL